VEARTDRLMSAVRWSGPVSTCTTPSISPTPTSAIKLRCPVSPAAAACSLEYPLYGSSAGSSALWVYVIAASCACRPHAEV
jgi:hypothetical protein